MAADYAYKREYIRGCIAHLRERHKELTQRCDSGKKWMLALWLGTIAVVVKEGVVARIALPLVALELLVFYLLEVYFCYFAIKYHRIISSLDEWIMGATDEEIEARARSMQDLVPAATREIRAECIRESIRSRAARAFYLAILGISVVICVIACDTSSGRIRKDKTEEPPGASNTIAPTEPSSPTK